MRPLFVLCCTLMVVSCATPDSSSTQDTSTDVSEDLGSSDVQADDTVDASIAASVQRVVLSGEPGAYSFSVTLKSPDTGCQRYADWWEVLTPKGELLYRRILGHSHVNEQPFTRSGGPVPVAADQEVWVRAHMNTAGYGGDVVVLTPDDMQSQRVITRPSPQAAELAQQAPLPAGCAF